jgi:hypothetical protein
VLRTKPLLPKGVHLKTNPVVKLVALGTYSVTNGQNIAVWAI